MVIVAAADLLLLNVVSSSIFFKISIRKHKPKWLRTHLLTAQVAFLSQGDSQVAVPPAKVVSQKG